MERNMKAAWKEERCPANTSPKAGARQSRLYMKRKAFGVSRINPYATFGCYVTAEYPYPSAFFFLQRKRGVPTHSLKWQKPLHRPINIESEAASCFGIDAPSVFRGDVRTEDKLLAAFILLNNFHTHTSSLLCPKAALPMGLVSKLLYIDTKKAQGCRPMGFPVSLTRRTAHSRVPKECEYSDC